MKHLTTMGAFLGLALAALPGACTKKDTNVPGDKPVCTEEAKVCPDGSSVSRTGPGCEFAECPSSDAEKPAPTPTDGEGEPAAQTGEEPAKDG